MGVAVGRLHSSGVMVLACLLACLALCDRAPAAQPGRAILPHLQDRFGLSEGQVRGALGALLVFASDKLPQTQFNELARLFPNGERSMEDVKAQGIVTGPLDDIDEYERVLTNLGMGESPAAEFAPAVLDYLGAEGFTLERDMLARVLD